MTELVLHHYPGSPFAEKARLMLGFKGLPWRSVTIPRWMPKPDLMPLTGGYRKTPVLQVGADIYCDSACIARELERRYPTLTLFPPGSRGVATMVGAWADRTLFFSVVGVVFGTHGEALPQALKEDRLRFSGGLIDTERYHRELPDLQAHVRGQLFWMERAFEDGRDYLLGPKPSYADFCAYGPVWMLVNRVPDLKFLDPVPRVQDWYGRMTAVGHGMPRDLDAKDALEIARDAQPEALTLNHPESPDGFVPGTKVVVAADDYGKDPVSGYLVALNAQQIVIRRGDKLVGEVNVHFPRVGYSLAQD